MTSASELFESMVLHDDACFLCGVHMSGDRTVEHVFPKWLQHKHQLWNQKLDLLNRTSIKYRLLTIPCCAKCNNEHLSRLEARVEAAFRAGYSAVKKLPALVLYQWAGKIFYGILRRELQLHANIRDQRAGTIIPKELIEGFTSLHLFLQSIRRPFVFHEGGHFSTLVVRMHYGEELGSFDFRDSLHPMIAAFRSNDIGVIVALQDAGIVRDTYGRYVAKVRGRRLVPIQFTELYAKVCYQVSLITRVPKFITGATDDPKKPVMVHMMPLAGLSSLPVMREWNQEEYAHFLVSALRQSYPEFTLKEVFSAPDKVMSWMNDSSGTLTFFTPLGQIVRSKKKSGPTRRQSQRRELSRRVRPKEL